MEKSKFDFKNIPLRKEETDSLSKQEMGDNPENIQQSLFGSAQESLEFLWSEKEREQVASLGVYLTKQILDGRTDHMFFIDKSARILGVYIHNILKQFDTPENHFSKDKIFFIYATRGGHFGHYFKNDSDLKKILEQKEEPLFNNKFEHNKTEQDRFDEGKVVNLVIDEFTETGKTVKTVVENLNRISESENVMNVPQALWTENENALPIVLFEDRRIPSFYKDKAISGVFEVPDNSNTVRPVKDKKSRDKAYSVRENLYKSSIFIADYIKNSVAGISTDNQMWKKHFRKDEERINTIGAIDLYPIKIRVEQILRIRDQKCIDWDVIHNLNDAYNQAEMLLKDEDEHKKYAGRVLMDWINITQKKDE